LRMIEIAQRLSTRKRTVLAAGADTSTGRTLFEKAARGGAQALGLRAGSIEAGCRADLVALATDGDLFADKQDDRLLDTLIFATSRPPVSDVFVGGRHIIQAGRHATQS
jgi:formimidoylglutamate deiminase